MHVNKANRGRQGRQKKATEKERDVGQNIQALDGGVCVDGWGVRRRLGAETEAGGSLKGALLRTRRGGEKALGKAGPGGRGCRTESRRRATRDTVGMMERDRAPVGKGRKEAEGDGCKELEGCKPGGARRAGRDEGRDREGPGGK